MSALFSRRSVTEFATAIAETKPELTTDELEGVLNKMLADLGVDPKTTEAAAKAATRAVGRKSAPPLRVRAAKKAGLYPCRVNPASFGTLGEKVILAEMRKLGVPELGCGRTFGSETRQKMHEAGDVKEAGDKAWDRFPYRCLSEIVPADKRDNR